MGRSIGGQRHLVGAEDRLVPVRPHLGILLALQRCVVVLGIFDAASGPGDLRYEDHVRAAGDTRNLFACIIILRRRGLARGEP
jgi:hypothetical protein